MAHRYTEWFPSKRNDQLAMARNWVAVLGTKAPAWNIPAALVQDMGARFTDAESAMTDAQNETTRTPVANARCRISFEALEAFMRNLKKRCFFVPPLEETDLISLGLKPHDPTHSPTGNPTGQVTIEFYLVGRHELGIKLVYITGSPDDRANKGYRIWFRVLEPGEAPPAGPEDLPKSFYTTRKKDVMSFAYGDSGKTVWMAVQIENEGRKGAWGPMVSALIP